MPSFRRRRRRVEDLQGTRAIADLIEAETSKDDAENSKPFPDIFEATLERLGHPSPGDTIVVDDTPYDIEAASHAGLRTIAVRC